MKEEQNPDLINHIENVIRDKFSKPEDIFELLDLKINQHEMYKSYIYKTYISLIYKLEKELAKDKAFKEANKDLFLIDDNKVIKGQELIELIEKQIKSTLQLFFRK